MKYHTKIRPPKTYQQHTESGCNAISPCIPCRYRSSMRVVEYTNLVGMKSIAQLRNLQAFLGHHGKHGSTSGIQSFSLKSDKIYGSASTNRHWEVIIWKRMDSLGKHAIHKALIGRQGEKGRQQRLNGPFKMVLLKSGQKLEFLSNRRRGKNKWKEKTPAARQKKLQRQDKAEQQGSFNGI